MKITVVYGPPASGKSTYVAENKSDNAFIYDFDKLMQVSSGLDPYERNENLLYAMVAFRTTFINLLNGDTPIDDAWLITSFPKEDLTKQLEGLNVTYHLMNTSKETCKKRIDSDEERKDKALWKQLIDDWFEQYEDKEINNRKEVNRLTQGQKPQKFYSMKQSATNKASADINIYGPIVSYVWGDEEVSASTFKKELDDLGDVKDINLYINSPGGSVFEGITIHNMLVRHPANINVHIDGVAASIASVIAMAGKIHMPKNSMLMIHNPWTFAMGNAKELRKQADDLDRIANSAIQTYLEKGGSKLNEDKLLQMLDEETWLSAEEAFSYGLADEVGAESQIAACIDDEIFKNYKNVPKALKEPGATVQNAISAEEMAYRQKLAEQSKQDLQYYNTILGGK